MNLTKQQIIKLAEDIAALEYPTGWRQDAFAQQIVSIITRTLSESQPPADEVRPVVSAQNDMPTTPEDVEKIAEK